MAGQLELSIARAALTVSQLVRMARAALEANLGQYWVAGEVSNVHLAGSGHCYFTLKDAHCAIRVVMFQAAYRRVRFRLEQGMEVLVSGRVSLYEARGDLQFYAEELAPRGAGALQIAFEQLKLRLAGEGLFDAARKRELPYLPRVVGVVTARSGAGLRDILRILFDRFPNLQVIVRPALVQGAAAAGEIAAAIDDLNADGRAETIIVGRGGGSLEDLWAFNEESVARAIFRSRIPIVSAVGHEIDFTIADFVADRRAPTPTAAAQMVVPEKAALRRQIDEARTRLRQAATAGIERYRNEIGHLRARIRDPRMTIRQTRQRADDLAAALDAAIAGRLMAARARLAELRAGMRSPAPLVRERRLNANRMAERFARSIAAALETARVRLGGAARRLDDVSPLRVLERGYAVVRHAATGRPLTTAEAVEIGDELDVLLYRGRLRARTIAREN